MRDMRGNLVLVKQRCRVRGGLFGLMRGFWVVDEVKIESFGELEEWLKTQDLRVSQAFAARSALRSLPAAMALVDQTFRGKAGGQFLLACLRATLTSGVTSTCSPVNVNNVRVAALSASHSASFANSHSALSKATASACNSAAHSARSAAVSIRSDTANTTAAHAACSAAISTRSVSDRSFSAALSDGETLRAGELFETFSAPLWLDHTPESALLAGWERFQTRDDPQGVWVFWEKWYRSMFEGTPMDWDLQLQAVLIDDKFWKEGPEAVARAIREIEQELAGPAPLEENVLRKHVEHLLKNPVLSEATALNSAETIERTISDYLRGAPANCLPEDLKHLEALPQHFKAIARVIGSRTSKNQKENQLTDEISKLHARVAALEKELAVAKSKELKGVISQEAAKSFGKTIGSPLFWSGAAVSVGYFFGVAPSDMTLENFRNYVEELLRVNAATTPPAQPPLPSSINV
ncbi:hypothetical protein SAMN06265373_11332 [Shimia sagamensis]|uniref:Uncharacterized protein n=2 Tax=Shimia sagamensis TaxID=1566352 RepID=A0ABY1PLD7_9RHOB|nr:hypothetical protein SAMN06265373_11332 [Shimia sagamensis]